LFSGAQGRFAFALCLLGPSKEALSVLPPFFSPFFKSGHAANGSFPRLVPGGSRRHLGYVALEQTFL